jgi:hypothetical protein
MNRNENRSSCFTATPSGPRQVEPSLPRLKYGYATTRLCWEELKHAIEILHDFDRLRRNESEQMTYEVFKSQLTSRWRSLTDYILSTKFHKPVICDSQTGLLSVDLSTDIAATTSQDSQLEISLNDFPYYLAQDIVHYILWKLGGGEITDNEIQQAKDRLLGSDTICLHNLKCDIERSKDIGELEHVVHTPSTITDMLHWRNPPHLQSLPDIDHVHILVRLSSASEESVSKS